MERTQLPTTRQRLLATARNTALAVLLGATGLPALAQDQVSNDTLTANMWTTVKNNWFKVYGNVGPNCGPSQFKYQFATPGTPYNQDYGGPETYFSLPGGPGEQTFYVGIQYDIVGAGFWWNWIVTVDGQPCASCTAETVELTEVYLNNSGDPYYTQKVKIKHHAGEAWSTNGVHEFGLKAAFNSGNWPEYRFKAAMLGTTFTDVIGYYDAPQLPLYILRDPPGDESYSSFTSTNGACYGQTQSVTTGNTGDGFFKARIGVAGTIPFVGFAYEIYGELGVDLSASQSETQTKEYLTCLETTLGYTTPQSGPPDDVFIGSSVRYAYGIGKGIVRPDCGTIARDAYFVSVPVGTNNQYNYTESYIRGSVLPDLQNILNSLIPGTQDYNEAANQISVWEQTLAMNDEIKAEAAVEITRNFNGGGSGFDHSLTSSTSTTKTIDYTASLESGLSFEFGVMIGGSGITAGGSAHFQHEYGSSQNASNTATNTMLYHLQDGEGGDNFSVKVAKDPVFGTYVFLLDSAVSATSCDYEGGYQLDQPQLWIGSMGSSNAQLNEVAIGANAIFPIYACNNSNEERTYLLTSDANSNPLGAIISGYNGITSGSTVSLTVPANSCGPVGNIYLSQPDNAVVDFDGVQLTLSSACGDAITSAVTLSAHFGAGNFGSYCQPSSTAGTTLGDYVDGVVLSNISNTGTGNVAGASYTDYSGQFSTPLSRNAQRIITITAGANTDDHFAAWIDYDHSGTFDPAEKLGEVVNTAAGEAQNISFTVPVSASLGSTILRVRGVHVGNGEPAPVDPCYSYQAGETEDYAVVINANAPQDCAGVNNGTALPGTACDDANASTGNDTWTANCLCAGVPVDCAGTPGGIALPGSTCDDANANTASDTYNANCECVGVTYDCAGIAGGTALPWTACDDGDPDTGNDIYSPGCVCMGTAYDCQGTIGGGAVPGSTCDDGNVLSGGDVYNANCQCVGTFAIDCAGVESGTAQPGTTCDDGDEATGLDIYGVNCVCAGQPYDCLAIAGGTALPGSSCDDGNSASENDVFTAECNCVGTLPNDCAGTPGGTAQPGTACDDSDATTGNDLWTAFCNCEGQLVDCSGVPGGIALPGAPCDDDDATTGNDALNANCQCAGQLIDCLGLPGGEALVGSACDDENASTSNDVYTANCICAGVLPNDCEGVAGGTAQPGTTCDDADATTGNDVYSTNCVCAGELIDCEGTIGGGVLPGTPCDDGVACTANDVRGADCVCSGTTITIGAVTGSTQVIGNTSNIYMVTPVANATSYNWALPSGWTTSDNSAFVVVAGVNNTPGDVELCVSAMVGTCELTSCVTVNVDFNTGITTGAATSTDWFTVQPNPSNGMFNIMPSDNAKEPVSISVRDGIGRNVIAPFTLSLERSFPLDMGNVAPGAYYLLATREGHQQVVKLVVQR